MVKKIKIVLTGGGTGGHLFPLLAVTREIRRLSEGKNIQLYYLGPRDPKSHFLLTHENVKVYPITYGKLRRYFSFQNIVDVALKMPMGCIESFFLMLFIRPQLVFSKGGSGSYPVTLVARLLKIPIFIHESDSIPGKSNQLAAGWAQKIFTSFEKTAYFDLSKTMVVGTPILKEITEGSKETAKEIFDLTLRKPVILFWGGSQGAQPINDFILNVLPQLLKDYEVVHVAGKKNYASVEAESRVILTSEMEAYYHLWAFLDETPLKHILAAADLVISRAGSGSIFELAACGKPSILIPLPTSANNHQSKNAYEYAKTGAAIVIEQDNLIPNFFLEKIRYLVSSAEVLEHMKQSALQFAKPLAAKAIAREILEFLNVHEK